MGKKLIDENRLSIKFPELANEWHPYRNNELKPFDVSFGSDKKVWWVSSCGHPSWEAPICRRTSQGRGCPYCSGHKTDFRESLLFTHQELLKQWHPRNDDDGFYPHMFLPGSTQEVWWNDNKGHEWKQIIRMRTQFGQGCPVCAGRVATIETCAATTHPYILDEWDYEKNIVSPFDLTKGSNKYIHFKCKKGHPSWKIKLNDRISRETNCPYCMNQKVCFDNCLATNFPEVAKDWHPVNNGTLTPYDVLKCSSKKIWWQCNINPNHEWEAVVDSRTSGESKTGCPICRLYKGETKINDILINKNLKFERQFEFEKCVYKRKLKFDFAIFIDDITYIIEYQGQQHSDEKSGINFLGEVKYRELLVRDKIKKNYCESEKIPFLEIHYYQFNDIEAIIENFLKNKI